VTRLSFVFSAMRYSEWPFVWFPLAGQRHAIDRGDRNVRLGSPMRTLCDTAHPRGPAGDVEWLWPNAVKLSPLQDHFLEYQPAETRRVKIVYTG
jgi:hypothetical protein